MLQIFEIASLTPLLNTHCGCIVTYYDRACKQIRIQKVEDDFEFELPENCILMPYAEEIEVAFERWFDSRDTLPLSVTDNDDWFDYWNKAEMEHFVEYMGWWMQAHNIVLDWTTLAII